MEGWDGSMHQASIPLAEVIPATVAWLNKRGKAMSIHTPPPGACPLAALLLA